MASLDPSEIRRRALLAATKVTLVLAVGCGGRTEDGAAVVLDVGADAEHETGTATVAPSDAHDDVADADVADAVSPRDASRCDAVVTAALADAGPPAISTDPEVVACCKEILPSWTFGGASPVPYEAARACCEVVAGEKWWELGYPACTPWGPPMPPSMDEVLS